MSSLEESPRRLGVVGAGTMGSGIAQNMAIEGFSSGSAAGDSLKTT